MTTGPTAQLSPAEEELLEQSEARRERPLAGGELAGEAGLAVLFVVLAVALALWLPGPGTTDPVLVTALTVAYALATRIEFTVGAGYTVPTQLVLVPLLFAAPPGLVPLFVAAGSLLGRVPDMLTGRIPADRMLVAIVNAWHAFGPAVVLAAAGVGEPSLHDWHVLGGALAAQFVVDAVAAVAREWAAEGVAPRLQLRVMGWIYLIDALLAPVGLLAALAAADEPYAALLILPLALLLWVFAAERTRRVEHALELSHAYRGTALLLGDVVEADDKYTGDHSRGVVELALTVADALRLDARERRELEFAALLHDVGKLAIPKEIINKPGKLTDEEFAIVKTHTIEGHRMLAKVGGLLGRVGVIVRSCHERWDGRGYPDGLAGQEIPLAARIVFVCDAFNAMTTDRPYRKARPAGEALEDLRANAGSQFDPRIVDVVEDVVERSLEMRAEAVVAAVLAG